MSFGSMTFLFGFLPAVLLCYFLLPARFRGVRNGILLLFSLLFYAWGGVRLLPVLLLSCAGNWAAALLAAPGRKHRRAVYLAALAADIAALGIYKYTGFFLRNLNGLGLGWRSPPSSCRPGSPFSPSRPSPTSPMYTGGLSRRSGAWGR